MSTPIQTGPPNVLVAGDYLTFSVPVIGAYSGNQGWTLEFCMMFPGESPYSVAGAVQSDGSFLVTVAPGNTDTIIPEQYATAYVYSNVGPPLQRQTIPGPPVWVTYDPTKPIAPTAAMLMLANFTQALTALSTGKVKTATIDGNSYTAKDMGEVQKQISIWQAAVNAEQDILKRLQGVPVADHIETIWRGPCYTPGYQGYGPGWGLWPGGGYG